MTVGIGAPMRDGSPSRSSRDQLSARGVALPYTATAPSIAARFAATVLASYRGSDSCLNDASCSSSTTTSPSRSTGAKIAERAPTTMRAAPDCDACTLVAPLGLRQPGVQNRDAIAEACAEPPDRLRRERDLRHEDDRREAALERCCSRLQVHLRLPAARGAVEEKVAPACVERGDDAREASP